MSDWTYYLSSKGIRQMTIAQNKAARRKMILRYGDGRRFGYSVQQAVEREKARAERERQRTASKKK